MTYDSHFSRTLPGFWAFAAERTRIFHLRLSGSGPPWTSDSILRDYHFTNVCREHDTGTIWFHAWCKRHRITSLSRLTFSSACYRLFNRITTFEEHGLPTPAALEEWFDKLQTAQRPLFTGRHTTIGLRRARVALTWLRDHGTALAATIRRAESAQAAHRELRRVPYLGMFFSNQVWCDLLETKAIQWSENDFISPGHGATWALEMIYDKRKVTDFRAETPKRANTIPLHQDRVDKAWQRLQKVHAGQRRFWDGDELTCKNIEHALCEFLRYHVIVETGRGARRKPA